MRKGRRESGDFSKEEKKKNILRRSGQNGKVGK
jgi:hypothetical protein